MTKRCGVCEQDKEVTDFYLRGGSTTPRSTCKSCYNVRTGRNSRARSYGLAPDEVEEQLAKATHCELCGDEFTKDNGPHFDHDHATGLLREALCGLCNRGLGHFRDNPEVLRKAARYVIKHRKLAQRRTLP